MRAKGVGYSAATKSSRVTKKKCFLLMLRHFVCAYCMPFLFPVRSLPVGLRHRFLTP